MHSCSPQQLVFYDLKIMSAKTYTFCTLLVAIMALIHETAYPRLRSNTSKSDLEKIFEPSPEDLALAKRHTRSQSARSGFIVLLKLFQRLGYFPRKAARQSSPDRRQPKIL